MKEIAASNAEAQKPEMAVDWQADVPTTASDTLIGEWQLRVLSPYVHKPEKHDRLNITAIHDGVVEGSFERYGDEGAFVDGRVREEDGRTILTFRTKNSAVWWAGVNSGDWVEHEAVFENGRFTGEARAADGTTGKPVGWYARRNNENDDYGTYLTWKNWMLKIIDVPDGFCEDRYRFFEDGTMETRSGEEVLKSTWRLDEEDDGHLTLVEEIISTNGKPDCQGEVKSQPGDVSVRYIVFANGGGWMVCSGPDRGLSCYATVASWAPAPAPPDRKSVV